MAKQHKLGWLGAGRMGYALAERLIKAGHDVTVYNRTRTKAEPLAALGAKLVDSPAALADRDIVFTIVAESDDFVAVTTGPHGVLSRRDAAPRILIDSSTVSEQASAEVRSAADKRGTALLCAPVSGNPKVVRAGKLSVVVSGPAAAYEEARPYLALFGQGVSYVGEGERARIVKICHNVMLGVVTQALAEITILAEKSGVSRQALLACLNSSVLGSTFSKYKTPAFVNLDFHPTFTASLLRKDFDLGLAAAQQREVPMPIASAVHQLVQSLVGYGFGEDDFAALLVLQARSAGLEITSEDAEVSDGLEPASHD